MDVKKIEKIHLPTTLRELWRLLNKRERRLVRNHVEFFHYRKNQKIYVEGGEPTHMMYLLTGKVKIHKSGAGGRNQIIRVIRPAQYFAYRAYFANERYLTNASAFESSTVGQLPMWVVRNIMKTNFDVCRFFIHQLSVDLGIADERTISLTQKHCRGRLAESLVFLTESYGLDADKSINIYLSRSEIANLSNMTTSNATRTLSSFIADKIVVVDGRRIKILDEEKLRKISKVG